MTIGPTSGHREFVHANLPSHAGNGEPAELARPGQHGEQGKAQGTGNGNGNAHGNDGLQGNGARTGGDNPASQANGGNEGPNGNQGSQGNYGGPHDSGSMGTGGVSLPGLLHIAPDIARQLGNTLFSAANGTQNVLRDAADGRAPPAHANANSNANSNANPAAGGPATSSSAPASANANTGSPAQARGDGISLSSGVNALGRALGAPIAQGAAPNTATTAAATTAATTTAASSSSTANTTGPLMSQAPASAMQQRAAMDAALMAANRPADAALAAGRTANTAPATAPPPATVVPPTLPNSPSLPSGTTAALAAAGLTMATAAVTPSVDARGVMLPANDAVAALRGENMLNPAGHTLDGAQRRGLRSRLQSMPSGGLARLLWAMGAIGHAGDDEVRSERDIQRAMQWLFWMLAVIAYGCLAAAIVVFVGGDGHIADDIVAQGRTRWLAAFGLATGAFAWWLARHLGRVRSRRNDA
ncbi:MAG: hypothetical protein ACREX5_21285 [Achromobacter pestifer]